MNKKGIIGLSCAIVCISADFVNAQTSIQVKNTQDFARNEIVSLSTGQLKTFLGKNKAEDLRIKDAQNNYLTIQWIDNNGDGKNDEVLFQAKVDAKKTNYYKIVADSKTAVPESKLTTYSRLVPERVDDYTWENDKIAFRVYGPKGQAEALAGVKVRFRAEWIFGLKEPKNQLSTNGTKVTLQILCIITEIREEKVTILIMSETAEEQEESGFGKMKNCRFQKISQALKRLQKVL